MNQSDKIHEALQMIDHHDWYWMMSEEYTRSYNAARASMRAFVATLKTITNESTREALRNLWLVRYDYARDAINGKQTNTTAKEAELMNTITLDLPTN